MASTHDLEKVLEAVENGTEDYFDVPIEGTDIMASTCTLDQAMDAFLAAFDVETCRALVKVVAETEGAWLQIIGHLPDSGDDSVPHFSEEIAEQMRAHLSPLGDALYEFNTLGREEVPSG